jgi:hypothetical protein
MSVPTLDPRDARPLTSREISKVLCAIIGSVVTADPRTRERVPQVLGLTKTPHTTAMLEVARAGVHPCPPSWELAFAATVSGFRGWCDPKDVDTAIEWVDCHLSQILGMLAQRMPS